MGEFLETPLGHDAQTKVPVRGDAKHRDVLNAESLITRRLKE